MLKLARTIHLDISDENVFARPAQTGEWVVSGGFEFSNWSEADLSGKARQAFANGWLGLSTFGRATFAAVARIEPAELEVVTQTLADHLNRIYGAPNAEAALSAARHEVSFMMELCEDQDLNAMLAVQRELTEAGVREQFRAIAAPDANIDQLAAHVTTED